MIDEIKHLNLFYSKKLGHTIIEAVIIIVTSLYAIKNTKHMLSTIPHTAYVQTRTLHATLVDKKRYIHGSSALLTILWSTTRLYLLKNGAR